MNKYSALLLPLIFLMGCNEANTSDNNKSQATTTETSQVKLSVDAVRNELMKHNFGQAEQLSDQLTAASPALLEAWIVAAEAKAANQNRLAALAALEQAFNRGFREVSIIEQSTYLADIRSAEEYRNLLKRFGLQATVAGTAKPRTQAAAGDVSIVESGGVTEVRAGDVSVKLPD